MDVKEFLHHAHERAVEFKTMRVREQGAKAAVPFIVVANRGNEHVATFFPDNRDPMLWTMRVAVGAFGCDLVAGTVDAYQVRSEAGPDGKYDHRIASRNPDTGKPWAPGDMERAFKLGRPWVSEQLMTNAIDRVERKIYSLGQTYKAKHYKIKFEEVAELSDKMSGLVPDALHEALDAPDVMATMNRELAKFKSEFGISPFDGMDTKERRAHADIVAMRLCAMAKVPVLYNVSDPDVRGIVEMSLGDEERNAEMGVPGLKLQPIIRGL